MASLADIQQMMEEILGKKPVLLKLLKINAKLSLVK